MAYNLRNRNFLKTKRTILPFLLVIQLSILMPVNVSAQSETKDFSRNQGFIIRPELYGALLAEFGYQVNPNFQISLGGGAELAEGQAFPELVLGIRTYATDTKWTAFFDYHIGLLLIGDYAIPDHRFTVGPSFKNFDFGGGIMYVNINGVGTWGFCLNIGYNFRINSKQ